MMRWLILAILACLPFAGLAQDGLAQGGPATLVADRIAFDAATLRRHAETFVALSTTEVSLATADGGANGGSAVLTACASLVAAACGLRRRPAQFEEA